MSLPPPQPMMGAGPTAGTGSTAGTDPELVLVAPPAPGSLGVPVDPAAAQTYLWALREWVAQRRSDLAAV